QNGVVPPEYLGPPASPVSGYVSLTLPTGETVTGVPMSLVNGVTLSEAEAAYEFSAAFRVPLPEGMPPITQQAIAEFQATYQQMVADGLVMGDLNGTNIMVNSAGKVVIIDNPINTSSAIAAEFGDVYAQEAVDNFTGQIDLAVNRLTKLSGFEA